LICIPGVFKGLTENTKPDSDISICLSIYYEQMHLVEKMQRKNPAFYQRLFRATLEGDSVEGRRLVETEYGRQFAEDVSREDFPIRNLIERV
jgi:hypothetical protein